MKTLTIVCPAMNEAEGIRAFHTALGAELQKVSGSYCATMLFVVDGATDRTFEILREIASENPRVQVLNLSRNFGHQMALLAGIDHADADVVIMMDSDLQHPPALIPRLLQEFEKGNDVVYTYREESSDIGAIRKAAGTLYYWLVNLVSDVPIHKNASDFRLISRRVAKVLQQQIRERNLFLRGVISWIGFRQALVPFKASQRFAGKSNYSLLRLIQFALFGLISFGKKPLRAATVVGLCFALFGFIFLVVTIFQYLMGQIPLTGYATIIVLVSLFGGVQLLFLGIIGEYIGAIFDEVKARPHYLIEDAVNIPLNESTF